MKEKVIHYILCDGYNYPFDEEVFCNTNILVKNVNGTVEEDLVTCKNCLKKLYNN